MSLPGLSVICSSEPQLGGGVGTHDTAAHERPHDEMNVQKEGTTRQTGGESKNRRRGGKTCDIGGMMVVSAGIGGIGITGINGEEGGAASAC